MKNLYFTILFILFTNSFLQAQKTPFGVKAGINVSSIGGDAENVSLKPGVHAGIFSYLPLTETLRIRPEILISNQGAKEPSDSKIRYSYWYLNSPWLVEIDLEEKTSFLIGPQFGIPLNGEMKNHRSKENVTSLLSNVDLAICFGFCSQLTDNLRFEVRYNFGLSNSSWYPNDEGDFFTNQVLQLTVLSYVLHK